MRNILEYLERTEEKYPNRTAVEEQHSQLTWRELGNLARKMGSAIGRRIQPGQPVVVLAEKSAGTLAAMLGTVYAGGFYVAVDPSLPAERIQRIFQELSPAFILTEFSELPRLRQLGWAGRSCLLQEAAQEPEDRPLLEQRRAGSRETDLLYGIFTSGSTGVPKGIVVSQKAVMDFIGHFTELFELDHEDRIGSQAPFDFDVSVKDIYSCLFTGATLVLIPKIFFSSPVLLLDYLCEKRVTVLIWAVSALTVVSSLKGLDYRKPDTVRKILFSGEVMPAKQLALWRKALPEAEFVNLYGPAEITCNCTYYRLPGDGGLPERLPIGRAFPGRDVFLLGENGNKLEQPGQVGEICVAGESLSQGYYGRLEENQKKFGVCLRGGNLERFYKTGDLGFWGEDGMLYFSGRKDFQIKHMGHRIELEEIEQALNRLDGVETSCCLLETPRSRLAAYYVGTAGPELVRRQLKQQLPAYMVPHRLVPVPAMPLNKNGKTDRNALRRQWEETA